MIRKIPIKGNSMSQHLPTLNVAQACTYSVAFTEIPFEISAVQITVIKADGTPLNPIPLSSKGNGEWEAKLPPVYFPSVERMSYEIWGLNTDNDIVAIGYGIVNVKKFCSGNMFPVSPSGAQIITAIPDASGRLHKVVAVEVDGEYTWQIED